MAHPNPMVPFHPLSLHSAHTEYPSLSSGSNQQSPTGKVPVPIPRRLTSLVPVEIGGSEDAVESLPRIHKQDLILSAGKGMRDIEISRSFSSSPPPHIHESHSSYTSHTHTTQTVESSLIQHKDFQRDPPVYDHHRRFSRLSLGGLPPGLQLYPGLSPTNQAITTKQQVKAGENPLSLFEGIVGPLDIESLLSLSSPSMSSQAGVLGEASGRGIKAISRRILFLKLPSSLSDINAEVPAIHTDKQGKSFVVIFPSNSPSSRSEAFAVET